jgi:hypothetical protein
MELNMNITNKINNKLEQISFKKKSNDVFFAELNELLNIEENYIHLTNKKCAEIIIDLCYVIHSKEVIVFIEHLFNSNFFIENKLKILSKIDYFLYSLDVFDENLYLQLFSLLLSQVNNEEEMKAIFYDESLKKYCTESIKEINKKEPNKTLMLLYNNIFKDFNHVIEKNFYNNLIKENNLYKIERNIENF